MTEYVQILHDRVGAWNKGQIVPAEELGTPDDLQRLVTLGAIVVLSGVFEPEETIIERIVEKVESAIDSVLHKEPETAPEPVVVAPVTAPVVANAAIVIPTTITAPPTVSTPPAKSEPPIPPIQRRST